VERYVTLHRIAAAAILQTAVGYAQRWRRRINPKWCEATMITDVCRPLARKIVTVTGAGRGIGAACARIIGQLGGAVLVNDIDRDAAAEVAREIVSGGAKAVPDGSDISSWVGCRSAIAACVDAFGRIDGLVNNAGIMRVDHVGDLSAESLEMMLAVNVVGVIGCSVHAIEAMRRQGGGAIVNLISGAYAGKENLAVYGATKGAVASFTFGCAVDLAKEGIRVNGVAPVGETQMRAAMDRFREEHGIAPASDSRPSPENNVPLIAYLLSDQAKAVQGQIYRVNGRRISVLSHPAALETVESDIDWTFGSVADAFDRSLLACQQPLGIPMN
jgi:NAD(P)-dependent dehydrogenase (short-subunit alcohol dehydrogenase family)